MCVLNFRQLQGASSSLDELYRDTADIQILLEMPEARERPPVGLFLTKSGSSSRLIDLTQIVFRSYRSSKLEESLVEVWIKFWCR